MRKICVITGSRAEYGLISRLMKAINELPELILQTVVTNMHLSPLYGNTYKEIENDGFIIDRKVDILKFNNSNLGIAQTTGLATQEFSKVLDELSPDIILILGDRFEMLAVASAALFLKIPVAHIHGGEITQGAIDDAIRHAITKMSHLHFTSTETYRKRVIQMGENPDDVFNVGAIGLDNINKIKLLFKEELEKSIEFKIGTPTFLITYHPATLDTMTSEEAISNLLNALDCFPRARFIFTMPNSDADSEIIGNMIKEFAIKRKDRCKVYSSLGYVRYLSALKFVDIVVGNSSSGIIEVPSFGIPTVNIGSRQKGRIAAKSVIHCGVIKEEICNAINKALSKESISFAKDIKNPYQKLGTVNSIIEILKSVKLENLCEKKFFDLEL